MITQVTTTTLGDGDEDGVEIPSLRSVLLFFFLLLSTIKPLNTERCMESTIHSVLAAQYANNGYIGYRKRSSCNKYIITKSH